MVKKHDYDNKNMIEVFLFNQMVIWCEKIIYLEVNPSREQLYPSV